MKTLIAAAAMAAVTACAACAPPPGEQVVPVVDVVGDSTLRMAQDAEPIEERRGFWGSAPVDAANQLLSDKILWVYAGTNHGYVATAADGPEDDLQAILDACVGKACMVAVQGVDPAFDKLALDSGLLICDLRNLGISRYDGVHADETGTRIMSGAVNDCRRGLTWVSTGRVTR